MEVSGKREVISAGTLHGRFNFGWEDKLVTGEGTRKIKHVGLSADGDKIVITLYHGKPITAVPSENVTAILDRNDFKRF